MFWYFKHEMLNTDILNYFKNETWDFKCETKPASRWHQVTVNKWVTATEPNHLNSWFIQERNIASCCSETQNSAVTVFGIIFVAK